MNTLLDTWETHLRAAGRSERTIGLRLQYLTRLEREHEQPLTTHTADTLTEWLATPSWSRATRRSARASLTTFYKWAHNHGHIEHNPAADLPTIRDTPPCPRPIPEDTYGKALAEAGGREHLALLLGGFCGLRVGEVAQVHERDLDRDMYGWTLTVHGKGDKTRVVPIPQEVAEALQQAFKESPYGWAFPNPFDMEKHVDGQRIARVCRPYLKGHTFHSLRHRYASRIYDKSADILSTQQLLGHSSPETTQRYVAIDRARLRKAAQLAV